MKVLKAENKNLSKNTTRIFTMYWLYIPISSLLLNLVHLGKPQLLHQLEFDMGATLNLITSINTTLQTNLDQISWFVSKNKRLTTWTLYDLNKLDFEFDSESISEENFSLSMTNKYLRFSTKWSLNGNKEFLLFLQTFDEMLAAIHNSGYARDSNAMFIFTVNQSPDMNLHFIQTYFTNLLQQQVSPFNGMIIFSFYSSPTIAQRSVLCYTCIDKNLKLVSKKYTAITQLKQFALHLNKNGHQRIVSVRTLPTAPSFGGHKKCLFELNKIEITNRKTILSFNVRM